MSLWWVRHLEKIERVQQKLEKGQDKWEVLIQI